MEETGEMEEGVVFEVAEGTMINWVAEVSSQVLIVQLFLRVVTLLH